MAVIKFKKLALVILISFFHRPVVFSWSAAAPADLQCELLSHPEWSVITDASPLFSWIVRSQQNNDFRTAYQVTVAPFAEGLNTSQGRIGDSGKVTSPESSDIE